MIRMIRPFYCPFYARTYAWPVKGVYKLNLALIRSLLQNQVKGNLLWHNLLYLAILLNDILNKLGILGTPYHQMWLIVGVQTIFRIRRFLVLDKRKINSNETWIWMNSCANGPKPFVNASFLYHTKEQMTNWDHKSSYLALCQTVLAESQALSGCKINREHVGKQNWTMEAMHL